LTLAQARALPTAAEQVQDDYTTVSLVTGARTEEMRALGWDHVDLDGDRHADPPVPPSIEVWRSVREGGDTKTRKSRRSLAAPQLAIRSLRRQLARQADRREQAGPRWVDSGRGFTSSSLGTELDAANVRRALPSNDQGGRARLRRVEPRELRHSFVSLMFDYGVLLEDIAPLVGYAGTSVTENVYRDSCGRSAEGGGHHGPDLPGRPAAVVTQLVTQARQSAKCPRLLPAVRSAAPKWSWDAASAVRQSNSPCHADGRAFARVPRTRSAGHRDR
jgi:integrase